MVVMRVCGKEIPDAVACQGVRCLFFFYINNHIWTLFLNSAAEKKPVRCRRLMYVHLSVAQSND